MASIDATRGARPTNRQNSKSSSAIETQKVLQHNLSDNGHSISPIESLIVNRVMLSRLRRRTWRMYFPPPLIDQAFEFSNLLFLPTSHPTVEREAQARHRWVCWVPSFALFVSVAVTAELPSGTHRRPWWDRRSGRRTVPRGAGGDIGTRADEALVIVGRGPRAGVGGRD